MVQLDHFPFCLTSSEWATLIVTSSDTVSQFMMTLCAEILIIPLCIETLAPSLCQHV